MKTRIITTFQKTALILIVSLFPLLSWAQQVEVQGELKVSQMNENQSGEKLVIQNADGTLGTRNVESLPQAGLPIDSTRNLASDFELQKLLCECPNPSPLLMKKLIESGYSTEDLINSGLPPEDVINASRSGVLYDSRDRHTYKTVQIGSQIWMAENLNIGNMIDSLSSPNNNNVIEKYCYRDMEGNCAVYGALYKWDEMMNYNTIESGKGICPDGWHIPSDEEWKLLEGHLGMTPSQADDINYRGTDQGSQIAGNEPLWLNGLLVQIYSFEGSGFFALPGGNLSTSGFYDRISRDNYFWTSSGGSTIAYWRSLGFNSRQIYRNTISKTEGYSVRCVAD